MARCGFRLFSILAVEEKFQRPIIAGKADVSDICYRIGIADVQQRFEFVVIREYFQFEICEKWRRESFYPRNWNGSVEMASSFTHL